MKEIIYQLKIKNQMIIYNNQKMDINNYLYNRKIIIRYLLNYRNQPIKKMSMKAKYNKLAKFMKLNKINKVIN